MQQEVTYQNMLGLEGIWTTGTLNLKYDRRRPHNASPRDRNCTQSELQHYS